MKKKLLMTASTFPRWENDTEPRFVLDLAKSLLPYFDVTVLAPMTLNAAKSEVLEGVNVIRYSYFPIEKLQTLCYPGAIVPRIKEKKVRALLVPFMILSLWAKLLSIRKNYDVVQAHWFIPQGIVQCCFKYPPYVVTGHGGDVTGMNKGIMRKLKAHCMKKAGAVTTVSNHLKTVLNNIYSDKDISVISMGCDTSMFSPSYRKENYFNQGDKKVVLFVGRLTEIKGVKYLIEAMKSVDAVLVIAGTGPLEAQLKEHALLLGNKVQFLGSKTHKELTEIYASSDVFCAPSIKDKNGAVEGFGLVFLEAMASGLPIVASRSGGIPDVVHDGENGLLCEPKNSTELAEKINSILLSNQLEEHLKIGGQKYAALYDYKNIGKKYAEVLNSVIKRENTNDASN